LKGFRSNNKEWEVRNPLMDRINNYIVLTIVLFSTDG
jgi:hypothetical protein